MFGFIGTMVAIAKQQIQRPTTVFEEHRLSTTFRDLQRRGDKGSIELGTVALVTERLNMVMRQIFGSPNIDMTVYVHVELTASVEGPVDAPVKLDIVGITNTLLDAVQDHGMTVDVHEHAESEQAPRRITIVFEEKTKELE